MTLASVLSRFVSGRRWYAVVLLGFMLPSGHAVANGWEHGAVPLDALVRALSFENVVIRQQAAESLGYRRQDEAVAPLLDRLNVPETDPWVRRAIYEALGRIGAKRATATLVRCLDKESLTPLRAACAESLGGIGTDEALEALLALLNKDADSAVRSGAVHALGAFESPAAVGALVDLIEGVEEPTLRRRAIRALGRTGSESAAAPLLSALEHAGDDGRLVIIQALTEVASPSATAPLAALLEQVRDPRLRAAIAVALGASQDGDAKPVLLAMLEDPVPAVRYMAIGGLERLGARDAAPALSALAEREAARLASRDTAGWIEEPLGTVASLSLQTRALQGAIELDPGAARDALLSAAAPVRVPRSSARALEVATGVYRRRRMGLYGLGYVDAGPDVVKVLAGGAGVADPDPRLRAVAARSLGVLNPEDAAGMILPLLADPAGEVRMTAARVLGRLGAKEAVPALEAALSDSWALVRKEAALALGYIGDPGAAAALNKLAAGDDSGDVRAAATYAVSLLTGDE